MGKIKIFSGWRKSTDRSFLGFQFPRTIRTVTRSFSPFSVGFMAVGYSNKKLAKAHGIKII
jgi:hypothetical protein